MAAFYHRVRSGTSRVGWQGFRDRVSYGVDFEQPDSGIPLYAAQEDQMTENKDALHQHYASMREDLLSAIDGLNDERMVVATIGVMEGT